MFLNLLTTVPSGSTIRPPFGRPRAAAMLPLCVLVSLAATAGASEALEKRVAVIAKNVAALLKAQQMDAIAIGQFVGPPNFPTSSGPVLVQMFSDEFAKHAITVKTRAKVGIAGEYAIAEVEAFDSVAGKNVKQLAIKVNGKLVDQFGGVLTSFNTEGIVDGEFDETVPGTDTLVETIGLPVDLPPGATPTQQDAILRDGLISPKVLLNDAGTRCRAGLNSPYEVEILVNGRPCPIRIEDDLPYVEIQPGQVYAVHVYNNSPYDAAVRLLIDGLSVFTFSEIRDAQTGRPKYSAYIMDPNHDAVLKGWHQTNEQVSSFLVTGYDQSAAAALGHTQELGTITLTFAAAWPHGSPPPPDEIITKSAAGNATGFGPPVEHRVQEVQRDIGRIRAAISVRYSR